MIQDNRKRQPQNPQPSNKERNATEEHPETSAAEEKTGKRISDQTSQEPKALADGTSDPSRKAGALPGLLLIANSKYSPKKSKCDLKRIGQPCDDQNW
jgi:hypothetical protein